MNERKALEKPEQKPDDLTIAYMCGVYDGKKLRTWVGLTDEEKTAIYEEEYNFGYELIEKTEAKLKEKNSGNT